MKETNHAGSRKTNKRWAGAKNDLALPVTLQFISSASWEVNTIILFFFSCFYTRHPAEVLKNDKVQRKEEVAAP